jgi:PKD repeat protein
VVVSTLNLSQYADEVLWLFGDGRSSSEWEPEIIYAQPDDYVLTLIAYNAAFGCSDTFSDTVRYRRTRALFDYSIDTVCTTFTDLSTGATTWDWNFGFPAGSDTSQNPNFVYNEPGEFFVTLTITYNGECETSYTHPVPIKVVKQPIVSFTVSDPNIDDTMHLGYRTHLIVENEQEVQFINPSLFVEGGYRWNISEESFPGNPVFTSMLEDPRYVFVFDSNKT